jgi:hypothetical protein
MYPRIAPARKRVATMLLRPDHTQRQTVAHNPIEAAAPRDSAGKL